MKHLALALLVLTALPVAAQDRPRAKPPPISLMETAERLARNGVEHHSARTIMAAAEILRVVERGSQRVRRLGALEGPTGPWEGPMTSAALLRLASQIASDDGDWDTAEYVAWLLQLPDSVPPTRGAAGGPVWADAYLGVGKEASYTIEFEGGSTKNLLQVSAGKSGAALQCTLHESRGQERPTLRARSLAGTCALEWDQPTRSAVTLRIRNAGPATYYVVSSN